MNLKELCDKKFNKALLLFSLFFLIFSLSLASSLYLKRYEKLLYIELENLAKEEKRLRDMEIKFKDYQLIPLFKEENHFETFLKSMDVLKTRVNNIMLNAKVQEGSIQFEINISGECSSEKLFDILDLNRRFNMASLCYKID